jgi:radical S-adenosyl methionine domain-containing protein 2
MEQQICLLAAYGWRCHFVCAEHIVCNNICLFCSMKIIQRVPSVNYHLWQPCNMKCGFCFAAFDDVRKDVLPKGHLPKNQSLEVVGLLAEAGFKKINFAGGEPLLCPWLSELIIHAHDLGMTTSIVTNGTKITQQWLDSVHGKLGWAALSVDSVNMETNQSIGRVYQGKSLSIDQILQTTALLKNNGVRLKINTVVCSKNKTEVLSSFIEKAMPERWKIFQVLPVKGQNDARIEEMKVSEDDFLNYIKINESVRLKGIVMVPEANDDMTDSYIMVDPAGRFFDNSGGGYKYSQAIASVGVRAAIGQIKISAEKFLSRDGLYRW